MKNITFIGTVLFLLAPIVLLGSSQYANAQDTSRQYANRQYTNGQYSNGQYSNGQYVNTQSTKTQIASTQSGFDIFANTQPRKPRRIENFGSKQLQTPPDLPYFPPYIGKLKYTTIFSNNNPNVPNGLSYGMIFYTTDTPETVIDFYRSVAKQYNWQIYNGSSEKSVSAGRKGYAFYTTIMRGTIPGYKAQVYVNYSILGGGA